MKEKPAKYRVFDKTKDAFFPVIGLEMTLHGQIYSVTYFDSTTNNKVTITTNFAVSQSLGITDLFKTELYEGDKVEFMTDDIFTGRASQKRRGLIVWNDRASYGQVGFCIIDETGALSHFDHNTECRKIGNFYQNNK